MIFASEPKNGGYRQAIRTFGAKSVSDAFIRLRAFRGFQLRHRAADVSFVLDCLQQLQREGTLPRRRGPRDPAPAALRALGPRLDLGGVSVCGQSFGGGVAAHVASADERFAACYALDAWVWTLPGMSRVIRAQGLSEDEREAVPEVVREMWEQEPPLWREDGDTETDGLQRDLAREARLESAGEEALALRPLLCPSLFFQSTGTWVPEASLDDVYGRDQWEDLDRLCAQDPARSAPAAQLYLEGSSHFDFTDITAWSPQVAEKIGIISTLHSKAGDRSGYAMQTLMLEAFLVLHGLASSLDFAPADGSRESFMLRFEEFATEHRDTHLRCSLGGRSPSKRAAVEAAAAEARGAAQRAALDALSSNDEAAGREEEEDADDEQPPQPTSPPFKAEQKESFASRRERGSLMRFAVGGGGGSGGSGNGSRGRSRSPAPALGGRRKGD